MKIQDRESVTDWSTQAGYLEAVAAPKALVLVAVDFSPDSEAALLWAWSYAEAVGAPIEILHVVHDPADSPGTYKPDGEDPLEPMFDVAQRKLAQFLEQFSRSNPKLSGLEAAKQLCVRGLPAQRILNVAKARGAGLLVLGSRRRNGVGRLLHGSTAGQVARQADLPVTIVKAERTADDLSSD